MPAAVAIPLILGAAGTATSLAGAKMASNASKKAADQQIASTDKAQAINERIYNDQSKLMQPYIQGGQDSFARLMANHWGTPLPPGMSPSGGTSAMLGNAARMNIPGAMQPPSPQGPPPWQQGPPPQGGQSLAQAQQGQQQMQAPPMQPQGGGGAPGGMVRLKAPNGQITMVPEAMAQEFIQKGAKPA